MFVCAVVAAAHDRWQLLPARAQVLFPSDAPDRPELLDGPDEIKSPSARLPDLNQPFVDVRIEGNVTILAEDIARYIETRPGRPTTPTQIRKDIASLYRTRWFYSVETRYRQTDEGPVLVFKVIERPVVGKVEYLGNKKIKTKHLAAQTGLKKGSPFDVSANRESARRLEDHYHDKGFTFATVELETGGHKDDRDVIFRIIEGPKVKVVAVKFKGNKFFGNQLLATKLRTKPALFWLIGGKYDPATIPDDIAAIKQYYHSLGFFDVRVDHEVKFSKKKSRARIEYMIDEGTRYKLRNVDVLGTDVISEKELRDGLTLTAGDFFNARKLNKDVQAIKDRYGKMGHVFANIDAVPRFLEEPGVADLVYQIDEDIPYTIRRINIHIRGDNPRTKRTVALNRIPFSPGDLANQKKIALSRSRLGGSQVFERGPGPAGPRVNVSKVVPKNLPSRTRTVRGQSSSTERRRKSIRSQSDHNRPSRRSRNAPRNLGASPSRKPDDERRFSGLVKSMERVGRRIRRPYSVPSRFSSASPVSSESPFRPASSSGDRSSNSGRSNSGRTGEDHTIRDGSGDNFIERIFRGQSYEDPFLPPQNPIFENSPQGDPLTPGQLDLDYYLSEARTGRLMFGVGVNSDAGVVGSIVLSEQNFDILRPPRSFRDFVDGTAWRGGGQQFRAEAVPGNIVSRYLVSWTDPYFLDTDYSLNVSGFFYNRFFPDWDETRGGGRVGVGKQFTPELSITGTVRLEEVNIDNPDLPTPQILIDALGSSLLSSFRTGVVHDTRDSPFLPGEGHRLELNYEQSFGDFTYPRVEAEARQYFTIYSRPDGEGRHILTIGGQLGWTDADTPIFERYFAGGFQTFRGFQFRGVSPRIFNVRVGGRWLALGSVEYQIPLLANETVQGVAFSDFGTVEEDFGFDELRITVGFGLRVTVPAMGPAPLAFDFAFPIAKEDFDDTRVFSFYVGLTR